MFCARCGSWAAGIETACTLCGAALPGAGARVAAATGSLPHAIGAAFPAVRYGGFWRRFTALAIDSCVLFFPGATLRVLLGIDPLSRFDPLTPAAWTASTMEMLLGWLYGAGLIASPARGTLGQQVMDLRVTGLRGGRVNFLLATWRYWAQLLSILTFGLGYVMQLATPRRQTLHDLVSGTVVVRPAQAPRPALASPAAESPA